MDDREAHIDIEDFDFIIPQLPSTKHLLKVIIKKLDVTKDKTDFKTHHFIKDPRLPHDLCLNDNFDIE